MERSASTLGRGSFLGPASATPVPREPDGDSDRHENLREHRLPGWKQTKHRQPWYVCKRRYVDDPSFLECGNTLTRKHDRQRRHQPRAITEELRDRQLSGVAEHGPGDDAQQSNR